MQTKIRDVLFNGDIPLGSRMNEAWFKSHGFSELYDYIMLNTSFLSDSVKFYARVFCILNDIIEHPTCKTCGAPTLYTRSTKNFKKYCNSTCIKNDPDISTIRKDACKKVDTAVANIKRSATMKAKYGVEFNSQRPEVKGILSKSKLELTNPSALIKLNDRTWLEKEYIINDRSASCIADEISVYYGTVIDYCEMHGFKIKRTSNVSKEEKKLCNWLESMNVNFIQSDWNILGNKEIDIHIPDHKIAIEINGLYHHSFNRKTTTIEKNKHLYKKHKCADAGIYLLQFTDEQINNQFDIVTSIISNKLNLNSRIFARKCDIREVQRKDEILFLDKNHIQGYTNSNIRYGLYFENRLVSIMSFCKSRFNKKADYELLRFCTELNLNVVGGASRLFKHFTRNVEFNAIITYADKMRSSGELYNVLGFDLMKDTAPGYGWTDGDILFNRQKFQRHKLNKVFKNVTDDMSESDIMFSNRYRQLWDCGQLVFIKYR